MCTCKSTLVIANVSKNVNGLSVIILKDTYSRDMTLIPFYISSVKFTFAINKIF